MSAKVQVEGLLVIDEQYLTLSCSSGTSFLKSTQSISKVAKTAIEDIDHPYLSIEWPSVVGQGGSA
jgi:hypothetical protein